MTSSTPKILLNKFKSIDLKEKSKDKNRKNKSSFSINNPETLSLLSHKKSSNNILDTSLP
jgi:hypothetical protein